MSRNFHNLSLCISPAPNTSPFSSRFTSSLQSSITITFLRVKSITLHMSQSASALQLQLSSHFFKSSQSLKFVSLLRMDVDFVEEAELDVLAIGCGEVHDGDGVEPSVSGCVWACSDCYPLCHINTSGMGTPMSMLGRVLSNSSSNVTVFSLRGFGGSLRTYCARTANGSWFCSSIKSCWGILGGNKSPPIDKSNSDTLRGTKYSINGSAP